MPRSRSAIALLLVLGVFALIGAGCGGDDDQTSPPAATTTETETETMPTETATTGEETTGGTESGDAANGEQVFASAGCGSCHTFSKAGTSGSVGPDLDDASPSFDKVVDQVTNGGGAMPPFKDQLSEQEIRDVAAFVSGS
jgi:mono/diheme cytochrome c family protein